MSFEHRTLLAILAIAAGAISGVAFETVVTPVHYSLEELPSMLILSPVVLTVGGNHYAATDAFRTPLTLIGLVSMPLIAGFLTWFMIKPRVASWLVLYSIVAFFYAGLIHKCLAVMSV